MKLIFTRSNTFISKFIRWGLEEDVSHVAIDMGETVFESGILGVDLSFKEHFMRGTEIVEEIDLWFMTEDERQEAKSYMKSLEGKWYDFLGFGYFSWRGFLKKFFGIKMPEVNEWAREDAYLCTGIMRIMPNRFIHGIDPEMTSPRGICNWVKKEIEMEQHGRPGI